MKGYLDDVPISEVIRFEKELISYIKQNKAEISNEILTEKKISPELEANLKKAIEEFKKIWG